MSSIVEGFKYWLDTEILIIITLLYPYALFFSSC